MRGSWKDLLHIITNAAHWHRYLRTHKEFDELLNQLMDHEAPVTGTFYRSRLICYLGHIPLWTGNYPYSYGHAYEGENLLGTQDRCGYRFRVDAGRNGLPSRMTTLRLRRYLAAHGHPPDDT